MRDYEVTVIFRTDEDYYQKGMEFVKEEFKNAKAEVLKEDDMGVRDLAYPIKKQPKGHYSYFEIKVDTDRIQDFDKTFNLSAPVLKYLFVKKEK